MPGWSGIRKSGRTVALLSPLLLVGLAGWMLAPAPASAPAAPREAVYVGEKVCRQCHHLSGNRNQFNPWRQTKHAKAYAALSMPEAEEIARLSGVEVPPHESPICLGCHTTAYDVEEWQMDDTFHFEDGIQCEQCHGPGSLYAETEIMMDRERAMAAGLRFPGEAECLVCHKEKGSHMAVLKVKPFDYKEFLKTIAHPGKGGGEPQPAAEPDVELLPGPKYVGALSCRTCHGVESETRTYGKWRYSRHARAYVVLGTNEAKRIAEEMGVEGNPQTSEECLACHTTGAGEPPGRFADTFDVAQGVQCESCHGPGSEYQLDAVMRDPIASADAGLWDVAPSTCVGCHQDGIHGYTFDYEAYWSEIDHTKWGEDYSTVEYKTPINLAVTADGERLFVACEASNSVIVVDPLRDEVLREIEVGSQPHFVTFSPDGSTVYVANRGSDSVSLVDAETYEVVATVGVGDEPHEMATNETGTRLYVANAGSEDISVVDLGVNAEIKRLAASRGTWGVAHAPDADLVYVTNNLPRFGPFRTTSVSEVTVVETGRSTVRTRHAVPGANLVQGIAFHPSGEFAMVTLIRTKSLVPMTRNIQGWIMTNGIGLLWKDGRVDQLLLDNLGDGFSDPTDIVFSRDGRYAFVTGGGVREVAVIDIAAVKRVLEEATPYEREEVLPNHMGLSTEFVVKRISVGQSPRGMTVSPDGRLLYVADGLDDALSVIDIQRLERVRTIDLGGPKEIILARYGERIFHSADVTYLRQFSCHSCHPDGHVDGITYDIEPDGLGVNPVDNRTLRGINDTAPFKWAGTNPTLRRQCGPRLAAFFTRADPFTPEEVEALDRYIVTIPRPPNRYRGIGEDLTPAQARGKRLFEREYDSSGNRLEPTQRCVFCHPPPYFTNRNQYDVGLGSELDTKFVFDVPHLNNIYDSAPYLHDGRAASLEEIWTIYNPNDTHGVTNDLTKDELNDLIEYIKTL